MYVHKLVLTILIYIISHLCKNRSYMMHSMAKYNKKAKVICRIAMPFKDVKEISGNWHQQHIHSCIKIALF